MIELKTVWVRGAGEMGSACALVLHNTGFKVFTSEREYPLAIRRTVTFSDAIYDGSAMVEEFSRAVLQLKKCSHGWTARRCR